MASGVKIAEVVKEQQAPSSTEAVAPGEKCPYELWGEETVFEGRWLRTKQINFRTAKGEQGVWQSSHRVTKPRGCDVDGVDIIAVLQKDGKKYYILIKQYRIPMRAFCLEFPAGLIDANESIEAAALRELKEETGYTGTRVLHQSRGIQGLDPGLTDDSIRFVTVEVDGSAAANVKPEQKLDGDESIEVVLVECDKLLEYVRAVEQTLHVEAMVYSFALGASMAALITN